MVTVRADAKFCSTRCRVFWHRNASKLPAELTSRARWACHFSKRPVQPDGRAASSTNPATWSTFKAVSEAHTGDGIGFMLNGDGIGCYDLDHVAESGRLSVEALRFLAELDAFHVEWSPSGTGVHAWVHAPAGPGWRRQIDGMAVEFYTRGRFMTVTGRPVAPI